MTNPDGTTAKISVLAVCGTAALAAADGKKLHKLILNRWGMSKTVEVDFAGALVSAPFLDEAIGQLILQFKKPDIVAKLKLTGLSPADKTVLNGIVVNRYHTARKAQEPKKLP